ncbi:MAG: 50S ribosomal protein L15 [Bacteroidales bacterium]|nr:50S ribosomal protein L15 [Bacteroidales bacterium]
MKLNNLTPAKGSTSSRKRVGRGEGSTRGGQSTRGMNGAKSRSGYSRKRGFEGGQMPIQRILPKFGFTNPTRVEYKPINLSVLESLAKDKGMTAISVEDIKAAGFAGKNALIKILGKGELTVKVDVVANAFSESAKAKIEALGGTATIAK